VSASVKTAARKGAPFGASLQAPGGTASVALIAAAFSSLLVGLSVVATRNVVQHTDPLLLGFLRYFPAGLCFLPALRGRIAAIALRDWPAIVALGCLFYGLYPWLFSAALNYTTALHGALIRPLLPMVTLAIGAALGREKPTREKFMGMALALAGITIAFVDSFSADTAGAEAWKGDILMMVGVILSAVFNVLSQPYIIRYSALTVTAVTMLAGSGILLAVVSASGVLAVPPEFGARDWFLVLFLSLGGAALANYLWIFALGRTVPSRVALFALSPPIIAAVLGTLLLGEAPSGMTLGGLFLVIGGIVVASRGRA
jgi:drug/metabolite transporter (DMT)-like permease